MTGGGLTAGFAGVEGAACGVRGAAGVFCAKRWKNASLLSAAAGGVAGPVSLDGGCICCARALSFSACSLRSVCAIRSVSGSGATAGYRSNTSRYL